MVMTHGIGLTLIDLNSKRSIYMYANFIILNIRRTLYKKV
jgi:hypothetical protein